jgi:hypothetical protein
MTASRPPYTRRKAEWGRPLIDEIWNARRYVVMAIECYLLAKPNVKLDDAIRKIAQEVAEIL